MKDSDDDRVPMVHSSNTTALVLDPNSMSSIMEMAKIMASGRSTIPDHLKNPADCMAVVIQAMQWRMNPYSIAQKTHLTPSGQLGYEAQLINAVATTCGALRTQPEFQFFGNWKAIQGKVKEMSNDKGKKYYVPDWNKKDEDGVGVICSAILRGEQDPRQIEVLLSQCYPRFSTGWATDTQQQITYAAVRKFVRRYAPAALLGVYTREELEDEDMPARIKPDPDRDILPEYPAEQFQKNLPAYCKAIETGKKTADQIISTIGSKYTVTKDQQSALRSVEAAKNQQGEDA